MNRFYSKLMVAVLCAVAPAGVVAQANFQPDYAGYSWREISHFFPGFGATDMVFLPNGEMLVAKMAGVVVRFNANEVQYGQLLDISDEVFSNGDSGMTAMLLDPEFETHPYLYLMYAVETNTDPANYDTGLERYGRIARYRLDPDNNYEVVPGSRQVLIGHDWSDGILLESMFHATGGMEWGDDGTLLFSAGDAADFGWVPTTGINIYGPDRFPTSLNIRSLRAQSLECFNAKINRVDRHTGNGLPTNPFYTGDPTDVQSKVWVRGLRNPWRFSVKYGSGDHTSFGQGPGVIWIGDVGLDTFEEINVTSKEGGENFGWPFYEGNLNAINPQAYDGPIPRPDISETSAPVAAFAHSIASVPSYPAGVTGNLLSNSITGGFFYDYKEQDNYTPSSPTPYTPILDGKYLAAEWALFGLFATEVDEFYNPVKFELVADGPIHQDMGGIVDMDYDPKTGKIYVLNFVRLFVLEYDPAGGPPFVTANATPDVGALPLTVTLDATGSYDPANSTLTYHWDFDDGTTATTSQPVTSHTFTEDKNHNVVVTASTPDDRRASHSLIVYAGNLPPEPVIITPAAGTTYPEDGSPINVYYSGTVTDPDGDTPEAKWRVALRHNDHRHELQETPGLDGNITIRHEEENTFYLFELFATDDRGYTVKVDRSIYNDGDTSHTAVVNWALY